VLVGGSGLYVRAALDPLEFPGTDPEVRSRWEAEAARIGPNRLHDELAQCDPAAAAAIQPSNVRRVVRALEAGELTGRPFAASMPAHEYVRPAVQVGLTRERGDLDLRIAARVDDMLAAGLLDEVRVLVEQGLRQGRTASAALGYRQLLAHLAGTLTLEQARDETVRATRAFARRQQKWFRQDRRIVWFDAEEPQLVEHALATVESAHAHSSPDPEKGVQAEGDGGP